MKTNKIERQNRTLVQSEELETTIPVDAFCGLDFSSSCSGNSSLLDLQEDDVLL